MNNILIPLDISSLPRGAVLYSLQLMRGRETNIFFLPVPLKQTCTDLHAFNDSEWDCAHFALRQEVSALQKKIENSFPEENWNLRLQNSVEGFREKGKKIDLIIFSTEIKTGSLLLLYQQLLYNIRAPWLFIPTGIKFTIPRKILLKIEPGEDVKETTLVPLKNFYGNHSFFVEIKKMYSGPVSLERERRDEVKLRNLFDIYHPSIRLINDKNLPVFNDREGQNFDLELLPQNMRSLRRKISNSDFTSGLSGLEIPLLIIPESENEYKLNFRSTRRNKKRTLSRP